MRAGRRRVPVAPSPTARGALGSRAARLTRAGRRHSSARVRRRASFRARPQRRGAPPARPHPATRSAESLGRRPVAVDARREQLVQRNSAPRAVARPERGRACRRLRTPLRRVPRDAVRCARRGRRRRSTRPGARPMRHRPARARDEGGGVDVEARWPSAAFSTMVAGDAAGVGGGGAALDAAPPRARAPARHRARAPPPPPPHLLLPAPPRTLTRIRARRSGSRRPARRSHSYSSDVKSER